ncbi:hypothetical protein L596_015598 [Steinernema carpocapsae]|uniref:Uncharacterized protein n=1 Tax=Steinernema carpocapsae TaxID=34508 RepID=A0A4V6A370_STECR|nr:hypothetical protein L596_015598 [Steinernema carpocapsae]
MNTTEEFPAIYTARDGIWMGFVFGVVVIVIVSSYVLLFIALKCLRKDLDKRRSNIQHADRPKEEGKPPFDGYPDVSAAAVEAKDATKPKNTRQKTTDREKPKEAKTERAKGGKSTTMTLQNIPQMISLVGRSDLPVGTTLKKKERVLAPAEPVLPVLSEWNVKKSTYPVAQDTKPRVHFGPLEVDYQMATGKASKRESRRQERRPVLKAVHTPILEDRKRKKSSAVASTQRREVTSTPKTKVERRSRTKKRSSKKETESKYAFAIPNPAYYGSPTFDFTQPSRTPESRVWEMEQRTQETPHFYPNPIYHMDSTQPPSLPKVSWRSPRTPFVEPEPLLAESISTKSSNPSTARKDFSVISAGSLDSEPILYKYADSVHDSDYDLGMPFYTSKV